MSTFRRDRDAVRSQFLGPRPALRLTGALEQAFKDEYGRKSLRVVRQAGVILTVVNSVVAIAGLLTGWSGDLLLGQVIRGLAPVGLIALTFHPRFLVWMQPAVMAYAVAYVSEVALSLPALIDTMAKQLGGSREGAVLSVTGFVIFGILVIYTVLRLRLRWAAPTAWTVAGVYALSVLRMGGVPIGGLVILVMWLVFANVLGFTVASITEGSFRREFVERHLLAAEREQSERLLLNVLPASVAARLKTQAGTIADSIKEATVLFADLVGFTVRTASLGPAELVTLLTAVFSAFDTLATRHGVEKIKTIGDAYMAVAGAPVARLDHAEAMANLALDMQAAIVTLNAQYGWDLQVRIGLATGPLVAGVIGQQKFAYDLWGDTVNTAARMEYHGLPGAIQVTDVTYGRLRERYDFEARGPLQVKGKGTLSTYLLLGRRELASEADTDEEWCAGAPDRGA